MKTLIHLLLKSERGASPVEMHRYDESVMLQVRDLTTRAVNQVPARDISCYLHTVFINGSAYQVLNVVKQSIQ